MVPLLRRISNSRARATCRRKTYCCNLEMCSNGGAFSEPYDSQLLQNILASYRFRRASWRLRPSSLPHREQLAQLTCHRLSPFFAHSSSMGFRHKTH